MKELLKLFSERGTFVDPEALDYISSKENPEEFANTILSKLQEMPLVLTLKEIKEIEEEECKEKETASKMLEEIPVGSGWKPLAREYESEVKILKDVTGKTSCKGSVEDFTKLFRHRYESLKNMFLSQRRGLRNTIPISKIKKKKIREVQLIGIVKDVHTTQKGHRIIEIEDEDDSISLLVTKDNYQLYQQAQEVVVDEIISVRAVSSRNGGLLVAQSIAFPDINVNHKKNRADVPLYAAFLADIHIGSKKFLEDQWKALIKWLNGEIGNSRQREVAGRVKYIVIPGDTVDGIGVYPNQEEELSIRDIYNQYKSLADELQKLPDHLSIIIQPGNHDAVRPAEPQPAFEEEIQDLFSGREFIFVGNPCYFSLHNIEVLSYHGQSLLDFATNIPTLKYNQPVEIMKIALKKRHLAPIYGGHTPIAPEHEDYMVIDRVPDIFVTGHVHLSSIGEYRGVTLINASSWQAQTSYQKMLNFIPDPAKLPIVDLKTGNATTMDFNRAV